MCICVVKQLHDTFCTKQNHSSLFNVCRSVCLLYNVKTSFSLGRNKRTDVRKMAYRSLSDNLNPLILTYVRRKRFHQILLEELPWRAQMNLYLANAHFHLFLQKLTERTKERLGSSYSSVRYRMMLVPSPPPPSSPGLRLGICMLEASVQQGCQNVYITLVIAVFSIVCYVGFFPKYMLNNVQCGANLHVP